MAREGEKQQNIGACVIVTNSQGSKILLGKRLNSYRSGWYGMPGGRLDVGEPLDECAKRELVEETAIMAKSVEFLGTIRENQGKYDFIHFVFKCNEYEGTVTLTEPDKCEGWEWYSLDNLPKPILPGHVSAIEVYKAQRNKNNQFLIDMPAPSK